MTSCYLGTGSGGPNKNPGTTSTYFTPGATPGGAAKPTGVEGAFPAGGNGAQSAYFGVGAQPAAGNQSAYFAVGAYNNPAATGGAPQATPMPAAPAPAPTSGGGASTMTAVGGVPPPSSGQSTMAAAGGLPMTGRPFNNDCCWSSYPS
ncbi:unnamed protein product, partial [Mesorhabditis belari]|uniref:Uncharacterized protein n=1 Tax=Mesorhabditis belari TaxID=2138241 RepID=A0AAF3J244_9BILA